MSMRVVRTQLFSLIICSSEVESAHPRGVEKPLALFIPHSLSRGCFPGWVCPQDSRHTHSSSARACGSDQDPPTGKFGFVCWGWHWRSMRTRLREPWREKHLGNGDSLPLSLGTRRRMRALQMSWFSSGTGNSLCSVTTSRELLLGATATSNPFTWVTVGFLPPAITRSSCWKVQATDSVKSCWQLPGNFYISNAFCPHFLYFLWFLSSSI